MLHKVRQVRLPCAVGFPRRARQVERAAAIHGTALEGHTASVEARAPGLLSPATTLAGLTRLRRRRFGEICKFAKAVVDRNQSLSCAKDFPGLDASTAVCTAIAPLGRQVRTSVRLKARLLQCEFWCVRKLATGSVAADLRGNTKDKERRTRPSCSDEILGSSENEELFCNHPPCATCCDDRRTV